MLAELGRCPLVVVRVPACDVLRARSSELGVLLEFAEIDSGVRLEGDLVNHRNCLHEVFQVRIFCARNFSF